MVSEHGWAWGRRHVAAALLVAVGLCTCGERSARFHLPARLPIERLVADLSATADPRAIVRLPAGATVHSAVLQPGDPYTAAGGRRDALVTPPGTVLRYRIRVPAEAALTFSVGLQGEWRRERGAAGVRFTVAVDGETRFARVVNPAATRHERAWFDERIDLAAVGARETEIVLTTEAAGSGKPAGTPGWHHVRVVARRYRERQAARADAPNVLVLLVDTLRADRLGCYGATPSPSPTLDRLAETGALFAEHVAQASWTMPSVASILTGRYPPAHGLIGDVLQTLPEELVTFPEAAAEAGITTVAVSASPVIHHGNNFAQGFETFVELDRTHDKEVASAGKAPATAGEVNDAFLRWLRENRTQRFLAYLHYMEPHHPYTPPARLRPPVPAGVRPRIAAGHLDQWGERIRSAEGFRLPDIEVGYLVGLYDAEIRAWDEELARLLGALEALDLRRTTVVIVTADHGEEFQEHGRLQHGQSLYEELIHVPLVVHGPGIAARRIGVQTEGVDLFPTVAAILGVPTPSDLPGRNLLAPALAPRPAYAMTVPGRLADGRKTTLYAVRTPTWKRIEAPSADHVEWYDLQHDPGERDDRARSVPDAEQAALAEALARWRAVVPPRLAAAPDPAFRDRLRALGYVE